MISFATSTAPDLHVVADVLRPLLVRARTLGVETLVVGAVARDLLVHHALGVPRTRATRDVDLALAVRGWADLDAVMAGYASPGGSAHTFLVGGVQVDVVPFRGVESPQRSIRWPDDHVMSVLGFEEALQDAVVVELPGAVTVRVASLAAQSLLKLLAWRDRRHDTTKDAVDLRTILLAASRGERFDLLYAEHPDVLERHDFDPELAGCEVLGTAARSIVADDATREVVGLLDEESLVGALSSAPGGDVARTRALVSAYRDGWLPG